MSEPSSLLTVSQVAGLAQCSEKTVRRAIDAGDLGAFFVGSRLRIDPDAARAWLTSRPAPRRQPTVRALRRGGTGRRVPERGSYADLMAIERKAAS